MPLVKKLRKLHGFTMSCLGQTIVNFRSFKDEQKKLTAANGNIFITYTDCRLELMTNEADHAVSVYKIEEENANKLLLGGSCNDDPDRFSAAAYICSGGFFDWRQSRFAKKLFNTIKRIRTHLRYLSRVIV